MGHLGPAGFVFRDRLALYWKILEPAKVVSRVRLGAYQAPGRFFPGENDNENHFHYAPIRI
jgi:hypothetical protein